MPESQVINIAGPMGSGKGTAANYLKEKHGFSVFKFSDILREEAQKQDLEPIRENLIHIYDSMRAKQGDDILARLSAERAQAGNSKRILFDGARNIAQTEFIRKTFPQTLFLYIDSEESLRKDRVLSRKRDIDPIQEDDLRKVMARDLQDVQACRELPGTVVVRNDGALDVFKEELDRLVVETGS